MLGICALLGVFAFFGLTPFGKQVAQEAAQQFGSTVVPDAQWFTSGFKYGTSNALFMSASLTLSNGQDQGVWKNNTGQPVVIDTTHLALTSSLSTSVASTSYQFSVGATSTPTIPEPEKLNWIVGATTPLSIDKFNLATSTATADAVGGLNNLIVADNYWMHSTSTAPYQSTFIMVPPNWYVFVKIDSNCAYAQAGITCELATSTNRGFTSVSIPFWYHYSSPN